MRVFHVTMIPLKLLYTMPRENTNNWYGKNS
jgi:hypothetical protein